MGDTGTFRNRLRGIIWLAIGPALLLGAGEAMARDDASDTGWRLEPRGRVEAGVVTARASTGDYEFIYIGDATYLRGQAGLDYGNQDTTISVEFDRIMIERFGEDRPSTDRDRLTATLSQRLDPAWDIALQLRRYDDLVTAEYNDTDALEAMAEIQFEPERAHRFRLGLTWRDREYDDGDGIDGASSHGQGMKLSGEYRYRLGRYHYVSLDLRAEQIDSDNARREFTRQSLAASYTHPLTGTLRVRPAMTVRHTRFPGRPTPTGEERDDTYLTPEVEFLWWPGKVRVEAEGKYVISGSNDPDRDRKGHRLALSIGYVF